MPKKLTLEEFITRSKKTHPGLYDYSKSKYINTNTKIEIICPYHGSFWQKPAKHLIGRGCQKCGGTKKLSKEEFIEKAKKIHGNKYDYFKVNYINSNIKIKIYCKTCKEYFWQLPISHTNGRGCQKCGINKKSKSNTLSSYDFFNKVKTLHNNQFDYSDSIYKNRQIKIKIYCKTCKKYFWQKPIYHLKAKTCPFCYGHKDTKEFIKKAIEIHGNKYDYSNIIYTNNRKKLKIYCKMCKEFFYQTGKSHLKGCGCSKCASNINGKRKRLGKKIFIERAQKIHYNLYDYSKIYYINTETPVEIICKKHGSFFQTPHMHLHNHGCPICKNSHGEMKIKIFLEKNNIKNISQKRFKNCKNKIPLPFDFYLSEFNTCIEFQGKQHYNGWNNCKKALKELQYRDNIKKQFCKNNNIKLLEIPYWDYDNINNILSEHFL